MNQKFLDRLNEVDITIDDIKLKIAEIIDDSFDYTAFIYCSHMEGLGTPNSDFDIYIIQNTKKQETSIVNYFKINDIVLDVEIWYEPQISALVTQLKDNLLDIKNIKFLHRLTISENIKDNFYGEKIRKIIDKKNIINQTREVFQAEVMSSMEDCIKLYEAEDYESALILARDMVQYSVAILNTDNGNVNLKEKWITRIFLNNNGYEEDFLYRYKNLYLYPDINPKYIKEHIQKLIELSEDMRLQLVFN